MKNKDSKQWIAVVLCCVFTVIIVGLYIADKAKERQNHEIYEVVMQEKEKEKIAREEAEKDYEERKSRARDNLNEAAQTYLPGLVFYGDSLTQGVGGNGVSYPAILRSLIKNDVYDVETAFVDVNNPVEKPGYAKYLPIVFTGTDSGWNGNVQSLIEEQKKYINGRERYIVIGIPTGTKEERTALEEAMETEYGDKYINLRQYLSTNGLSSLELEIHPEDKAAMDKGRTPPGLMNSDMIHLNDNGYKLVAFLAYDRMTTLGYFDEVKAAAEILDEYEVDEENEIEEKTEGGSK